MHHQEPAQEHQVQVQGERAPRCSTVEAGDYVPLLIIYFPASERHGWGRASDGEDAEAHSEPMTHLFAGFGQQEGCGQNISA